MIHLEANKIDYFLVFFWVFYLLGWSPLEVKLKSRSLHCSSQPQIEIISTEQTHKIVIKTKQRGTEAGWILANYQKLFNEKVFYNFRANLQGFVGSIFIIFWELSREGLFGNILELMKCCHHKYCFEEGSMYTSLN